MAQSAQRVVESATERVVVLMTPTQKAEANRRAEDAQLSLSGFMVRQALGDEDVLLEVVAQLRESTAGALSSLDQAVSRLAESQAPRPERDAAVRAQAMAEFADVDPEAFADLVIDRLPEFSRSATR